jgi:peroxiredoxin
VARTSIETGSEAPAFDLQVLGSERVRLADFRGRRNVLLVFHPFAYTAVCAEEAQDLEENLDSFGRSDTDVILVSCDSAPVRQAWKRELGLTYAVASDFWPHGEAARAYGIFDERTGASVRGTFLIDRQGTVVWTLVKQSDSRRGELTGGLAVAERE